MIRPGASLAVAALVAGLGAGACAGGSAAAEPAPRPSDRADARLTQPRVQPRSPEAAAREVFILKEQGPSYTPYDRPPEIVWSEETDILLARTLLPVLQEHGFPARTSSRYWLLVGADGQVHEVVLQLGLANEDFHRAGAEVARHLRFSPAVRDGQPIGVWLLQEISLVMQ